VCVTLKLWWKHAQCVAIQVYSSCLFCCLEADKVLISTKRQLYKETIVRSTFACMCIWIYSVSHEMLEILQMLICWLILRDKYYVSISLRPGTHYPHVTWAHVTLRVQLGCESGFNIEFYGADSHFCHCAYATWSHVPARLSHSCCRTHFVRRDVRVESRHCNQLFPEREEMLIEKVRQRTIYVTPTRQIIEIQRTGWNREGVELTWREGSVSPALILALT
jgi:hypothetical protein